MNLWGRLRRWALILSVPIFLGCEDPNEIGSELNPNSNNLSTNYREFVLPTSVVWSDSVATNDPNNWMTGTYDDPIFGKTTVTAYTQLGVFDSGNGPQDRIPEDAVHDSTDLYLHYKFFYGSDFTGQQRLDIHTLEDTLFQFITYKTTIKTPISRDPVGSVLFRATAGIDTLLVIRMNDDYGELMMGFARDRNLIAKNQPDFTNNEIPGLAFVPGDQNDYIIGIEDEVQATDSVRVEESTAIRVYFHREEDPTQTGYFDYVLDGIAQYMSVETDRSNSDLSGLTAPFEEYVPSNGLRYIQPLTGISTKVDMTPVWAFIDSLSGFVINKAEMEVSEVIDIGGTEDFITPLDNFSLLFTGEENKVANGRLVFNATANIATVVLDDGSYNSSLSNPLRIPYVPSQLLYRAEISNYLQAAADSVLERRDLMIYPLTLATNPDDAANPIEQMVMDASKIKIKLFYSTIE